MPEPVNPGEGENPNPGTNQPGDGKGTDPSKTDAQSQPLDLSKVGDEDFNKVFDDPRTFKHPRFKSLLERAKKADELETAQQKAEEKRLIEQKKFEELANKKSQEAQDWQSKYTQSIADNRILAAASKAGVVDTDAVLKLIDRSGVVISEDGSISGVDEAVKALLESKPYLKGASGSVTVGSPTNPGEQPGAKKFKLSQLQDTAFFRANEKEIMEAQKNGLIEDDMV